MSDQSLSRAALRAVDQRTSAVYGLPGIVLMEHAGRSLAELVMRVGGAARAVFVFAGPGNNGGDGFVIARWLHDRGYRVECLCLADLESTRGDARTARAVAVKSGVMFHAIASEPEFAAVRARLLAELGPVLLIDALLGTGFAGALRTPMARAIAFVNELREKQGALTFAVDIPSGLDCDTGAAADPTVRADWTGTFVAPKLGFATPNARELLGRVEVLTIGAPRRAIEEASSEAT